MEAYIYHAPGHNPYENLAIEEFFTEYVTEHAEKSIAIVYFWQNEDSVIFGRNQNVASESNLSLMQQWNVHPVRRKTGGGAVFHDIRNLNFSFIVSKEKYNKEASMLIIRDALRQLGIPAEINGRNDILLEDAKISGNAYSSNESMSLHHGTLLLSVDLDKLERLLTVDQSKLQSKGVHSVRSRVQNLQEHYPLITIDEYKDTISKQFCKCYEIEHLETFTVSFDHMAVIQKIKQQYASPQWIFGHDLSQLRSMTKRFSWGTCTVGYFATDTEDEYVDLYSDTLYAEEFEQVRQYIRRTSFIQKCNEEAIQNVQFPEIERIMLHDIEELISSQNEE